MLAGFIVSRNIYNSDNYRYLVFLLVPWCLGVGRVLAWFSKRGLGGRVAAIVLAGAFAVFLTLDTAEWYRRFGWLDSGWRVVRVPAKDSARNWLAQHPEITAIYGDYWDVYRIAFLEKGRITGVPYKVYPDRYDRAKDFPGYRPNLLIARPREHGPFFQERALREGGVVLYQDPSVVIINWPYSP